MTKFNVGDKVVPISKTVGGYGRLEESCAWNRVKSNKNPFLYVTGFEENDKFYICGVEEGRGIDFFNESDLIPYKKETKNERITTLENEVAELKLIVHELRERPQLTTVVNNQGTSTTNTVEDIIEFEGVKYRKVNREAREGDVIVFYGSHHPQITGGKPYKVFKGENTKENKLSHVADSGTEYPVDGEYVDGYYVYELNESKPLTPNQQRAAIIEKAKKFVEENNNKIHPGNDERTTIRFTGNITDKLEFVVNVEKRTVVALIKGIVSGDLYARGIAKCNPSDVFNEHIGKAIALGRALSLDVSEFEQAVQPTEFTKGQVAVGGTMYQEPREVTKVTHGDHVYRKPIGGSDDDDSWRHAKHLTIINDTNAKYEEGQ